MKIPQSNELNEASSTSVAPCIVAAALAEQLYTILLHGIRMASYVG